MPICIIKSYVGVRVKMCGLKDVVMSPLLSRHWPHVGGARERKAAQGL